MLREYEFTVITSPQMTEEDSRKLFEKYESVLFADGGEVIKKSVWGTKKLAYPIKKQFRGHYVFYDMAVRPEHLSEAERLMRIDENILRYMSVRIANEVNVDQRKAEIARAEMEAAKQSMMSRNRDEEDEDDADEELA